METADVCGPDILTRTDRQTERVTPAEGVAEGESAREAIKLAGSKATADVNELIP